MSGLHEALGPDGVIARTDHKLRECPFCGSEAGLDGDGDVSCSNKRCTLYTRYFSVEEWNHRSHDAELSALKQQNAVMREALEAIDDACFEDVCDTDFSKLSTALPILRDALAKIRAAK